MFRYFFPTSDIEREWAITSPGRFLVRVFLRGAATIALVLSVIDVVWHSSAADDTPVSRLRFIVLWSLTMALLNLWAARHLRQNRAGTNSSSSQAAL